jgi:hypothetical protein
MARKRYTPETIIRKLPMSVNTPSVPMLSIGKPMPSRGLVSLINRQRKRDVTTPSGLRWMLITLLSGKTSDS